VSSFPDTCIVSIEGVQRTLAGFFLNAAQVGQCTAQAVSKSKYRQTLSGIDGIRFSQEFFSSTQLDVIQGGGTWVYHQLPSGAVTTRHSLTTDITSPLTRNPTSTWQVDKYSRLVRNAVRRTLGSTITLSLLDEISMKIRAVGKIQVDKAELSRSSVSSIEQGDGTTADIDQIIVRGEASPLQPNNGIQFFITISA
jgi:hypothetical protein